MKKIGIITYHNAINYGAALQSKALFDYLTINYQNCEFEIINYVNDKIANSKKIKSIIKNKKFNSKQKFKQILGTLMTSIQVRRFKKYLKNVKYSRIYTNKNIKDIENIYDFFIIGSDQVWNYKINNNDDNYLLDFIKNKKRVFTYASSLGLSKIDEEHKNKFKKTIAFYNKISMREKEGKDLVEKITERDITLVLDPVFLMLSSWKKNYASKYKNKKIVTLYLFNTEYIKISNQIIKNKPEYLIDKINGNITFSDFFKKNVKVGTTYGPEEFLKSIVNSSFILTDSFHCVAMSIIFHKDFVVFLDNKIMETNSRMHNLLKIAGLEDRIYDSKVDIEKLKPIDWNKVDENIKSYREDSVKYIEEIIKEINSGV